MATELSTCTWYKPCKWSKWVTIMEGKQSFMGYGSQPVIIQEQTCTGCNKKRRQTVEIG